MRKLTKKQQSLIKTPQQIAGIRKAGVLNTAVLDMVEEKIREGVSTEDINRWVHEFTLAHGGIPAPLNYEGFPKSCCTSLNDVVCHGIPSDEEILEEGDIVNVDVTTIVDGYYADASRMFMIGKVDEEDARLVRVAKECMEAGAAALFPGCFVNEQAKAIVKLAHQNGYTVVRDLCGHGVGTKFHEDLEIDHFETGKKGAMLLPGMVFTIEPMINAGSHDVCVDADDGWTVFTDDGEWSAQWEKTYLMTEEGLEIITH